MADPHFGRKVLGDSVFAAQKRITSVGAHHFGSKVVSRPAASVPATASATFDIRELKVHEALDYIAKTDASEYPTLLAQEREHPKYLGGRRMVLDALAQDDEIVPVDAPAALGDDEGDED